MGDTANPITANIERGAQPTFTELLGSFGKVALEKFFFYKHNQLVQTIRYFLRKLTQLAQFFVVVDTIDAIFRCN